MKRLAATLRGLGVGKGDRVAIYMGMVPEAVIAMLACARIGAPHTVVFGGFAAESLRDRINDCSAKVVLTQDGGLRRGNVVPLKATVDKALEGTPSVEKVLVLRHLGQEKAPITLQPGRDLDWFEAQAGRDIEKDGAPEIVDAEHPLFILYTSGSTGKPKGVLAHDRRLPRRRAPHLQVRLRSPRRRHLLVHGRHRLGHRATATSCTARSRTARRACSTKARRIFPTGAVSGASSRNTRSRSSTRRRRRSAPSSARAPSGRARATFRACACSAAWASPSIPKRGSGTTRTSGEKRCPVVDTWWQTETGAIMLTTLPGVHTMKPGATGLPFFGVEPAVVTADGNRCPARSGAACSCFRRPWPSMLRTVWGDDERYQKQYFSDIPGSYFTGDGAHRDADGYFHVVGRIDDVLNVAGHRIGTAEIESALVSHPAVAEAAAVGRPDELKGQALVAFVTLKPGHAPDAAMKQALAEHVAQEIGKFARPDDVRFADGLPKTRSGKIMRRLLKDVAAGREAQGDISTLEDFTVLAKLREDE